MAQDQCTQLAPSAAVFGYNLTHSWEPHAAVLGKDFGYMPLWTTVAVQPFTGERLWIDADTPGHNARARSGGGWRAECGSTTFSRYYELNAPFVNCKSSKIPLLRHTYDTCELAGVIFGVTEGVGLPEPPPGLEARRRSLSSQHDKE